MNSRFAIVPGEVLLSLVLIAIGSFVVYETRSIAETQSAGQVGPRRATTARTESSCSSGSTTNNGKLLARQTAGSLQGSRPNCRPKPT
jgi:hypothetical protein